MTNLDTLFKPRAIAVIGASGNPMKWGFIIPMNIISGGYKGEIHLVNPSGSEIMGKNSYKRIRDIPGLIDLAVITTPIHTVPEIIAECAQSNIRSVIVITAGYSETGPEGARLEEKIVDAARSGGIQLVGPNTMGIFCAEMSLCCLMPIVRPLKGPVAFVAQSGNIGAQLLSLGKIEGVGFSKFASSGNEGVLKCMDYIEYFGDDPATRIILAYIEGVDDGRRFLNVAKKITLQKPIIVFKAGITKSGSRAAASHTGAMAGSDKIYDSAFKQGGIIRASSTVEMLDLARYFSSLPFKISKMRTGRRVGILTWGGGLGVVTADLCEDAGLDVVELPNRVIEKLDRFLPPYWSRGNPVDIVGTLDMGSHLKSLEAMAQCDNIDGIIALGVIGYSKSILSKDKSIDIDISNIPDESLKQFLNEVKNSDKKLQERVSELMRKYKKPIIGVRLTLEKEEEIDLSTKVPIYPTPERAVGVMVKLFSYRRYLENH